MSRFSLFAAVVCFSLAADAQRVRVARPQQDAPIRSAISATLKYYGGHVIPNVKVYQVNWTNFSPGAPPDMSAFFTAVTNSNYLDWLYEYDTNITIQAGTHSGAGTDELIGRGSYAGVFTITPSAGNSGSSAACTGGNVTNCCLPDAPSGFSCIDDTQVQDELQKQIDAGHLPPNDANTLYFIYFPPSVIIGQGGSSSCQIHSFCAYHGTTPDNGSGELYYAVMPDFSSSGSGCDNGCGIVSDTLVQRLGEVSSHELVEAITDAEVGIGVNVDFPLAWYDTTSGEIGDICDSTGYVTLTGSGTSAISVQNLWSNKANSCVASRQAANDFILSFSPNTRTITAGAAATMVTVAPVNHGTAQTLTLSVTGVPPGVHATLGASSISTTGSTTISLSADSGTAAIADATIQLVATNSGAPAITHTAGLLLHVLPEVVAGNDFSLGVTPGSRLIAAGSTADYVVSITKTSGAAEDVTLSFGTLPSGVHGTWSNGTATSDPITSSGGSDTLTLSVDNGTANLAATTFSIKGTSTSVPAGHSITATVEVGVPVANDFSLSITPPARTVLSSGTQTTASFTIDTALVSGSAEDIVFSNDLSLSGVTAAFNPTHVSAGGSTTLTLTIGAGAPATAGAITFTVTGTATSAMHDASADVTVTTNNFSLSISPSSAQTITSNGTRVFTVSAAKTAGAPANVALDVTGLPAGVGFSFDNSAIDPVPGSATLTLTATSAPASAATVFTVTGTDDEGLVRTTTGSIQVLAGNDFTLSLSSGSVTLARGAQTSLSVTTAAAGTPGTVALSASGLPSGVTASFSPASVTAGGGSTLTLTASSSALITNGASFTVTGTSGGISHGANATITVTGTPGTPTVSILHPASGDTVSGAVEIDVSATPAAGSALLRIDVMVDGTVIGNSTTSPGSVFWTSSQSGDGSHTLTAKAIDADTGNATSPAVTVTVNNSGGGGSPGGGGKGCSTSGASLGGLALLGLFALRRRKR